MKRFFTQLAIFAGILLVLAIAFDRIISSGLKKTERGHFHTMNALMNDSINADVIILGGSRASYMYNPHVIDTMLKCNSFNLGVSGQPMGVSCLRWQLYNRKNNPPKLIIINCDYLELRGMVDNGFEREQYYPYMTDPIVKRYLDAYGFNWADKYIPMYRYHGAYKYIGIGLTEFLHIRHDKKGSPYKGYTPSYSEWNGDNLEKMIEEDKIQCVINKEAVALMDSLISDAQEKGTCVVFVQAPYYSRLQENLDDKPARDIYDSLANKYSIPYFDYTNKTLCDSLIYFADGCHLNNKGSDVFTQLLCQDVDSLNLIK